YPFPPLHQFLRIAASKAFLKLPIAHFGESAQDSVNGLAPLDLLIRQILQSTNPSITFLPRLFSQGVNFARDQELPETDYSPLGHALHVLWIAPAQFLQHERAIPFCPQGPQRRMDHHDPIRRLNLAQYLVV